MKCPSCGAESTDGKAFCSKCGGKMTAVQAAQPPAAAAVPVVPAYASTARAVATADPRFQHDKYLFNQKKFSIRESYTVFDENGQELFFIRRTLLALKRHTYIYADRSMSEILLTVLQENFFAFLYQRFTLVDASNNVVARLRRRSLISIIRRTWDVMSPDGAVIGTVMEDSLFKALFRRFGPLGEYLKTDFIFLFGGRIVGKFVRKLTLFDKYVLDLTPDAGKVVDRRLAVAIAVLLDSAEHR